MISEPPSDWTPRTHRFVALYRRLFELERTGGVLHAALDDGNLEDVHLEWHRQDRDGGGWDYTKEQRYGTRWTAEEWQTIRAMCDEILAILRSLTVEQRYAALAYADGTAPIPEETQQ